MRRPVQLIIVAALLAASLSWGFEALAAPSNINFQGRLTDPDGTAVPNGWYKMTFRIYSAGTGGTLLWSEDRNIRVQDGMYTTTLGAVTPLTPDLFSTDWRYLEVWVNGEQLTPRQRIRSVGYAMNAHTLDGIEASGFATTAALDGKADTVHVHSGGQITTGTVAEARIDPAIARKAEVDAQIAALQSALTTLQSTVDTQQAKITSLQSTVDTQQAKIEELTSLLAGVSKTGIPSFSPG